MTTDKLRDLFSKHSDDEFLKFARVKNKLSNRPDLHAFQLLDRLVPGNRDIVSAAEHDKIWLEIEPGVLAAVATEADVIDLVRCGVGLYDSDEGLCMFA